MSLTIQHPERVALARIYQTFAEIDGVNEQLLTLADQMRSKLDERDVLVASVRKDEQIIGAKLNGAVPSRDDVINDVIMEIMLTVDGEVLSPKPTQRPTWWRMAWGDWEPSPVEMLVLEALAENGGSTREIKRYVDSVRIQQGGPAVSLDRLYKVIYRLRRKGKVAADRKVIDASGKKKGANHFVLVG